MLIVAIIRASRVLPSIDMQRVDRCRRIGQAPCHGRSPVSDGLKVPEYASLLPGYAC